MEFVERNQVHPFDAAFFQFVHAFNNINESEKQKIFAFADSQLVNSNQRQNLRELIETACSNLFTCTCQDCPHKRELDIVNGRQSMYK
jgi:hypothetical protein